MTRDPNLSLKPKLVFLLSAFRESTFVFASDAAIFISVLTVLPRLASVFTVLQGWQGLSGNFMLACLPEAEIGTS